MSALVTASTIAAVNSAREALREAQANLKLAFTSQTAPEGVDDRDLGRVEAYAEIAADALFDFINMADTYLGLNVPSHAMHLTKADE